MVIKMQSHLRGHHVRVHKDEGLLVLEALYGKKLHDAPGFNSDGAAIRHMVKEVSPCLDPPPVIVQRILNTAPLIPPGLARSWHSCMP